MRSLSVFFANAFINGFWWFRYWFWSSLCTNGQEKISVDFVGSIGEIFFWLTVIVLPDNKIKRKSTTANYREMKIESFFKMKC